MTSFLVLDAAFENDEDTDGFSAGNPKRRTRPNMVSFSKPGPDRRRYPAREDPDMACIMWNSRACWADVPGGGLGTGGVIFSMAPGVFAGGRRNEGIRVREKAAFLWVHSSRNAEVRKSPLPPTPSDEPSSRMVSHLDNEAVMH